MRNSRHNHTTLSRVRLGALTLLILSFLSPLTLIAQTNSTWVGTAGGGDGVSWNDPLNWSAGVPNGAFNAFIDSDNGLISNVLTGTSSSFFVESLTVDAGDSLTIQNASDFGIVTNANPLSGNINNNGTIFITNGSSNTDLVIDGVVNVNGSGTITLGGSAETSRILDQSGDDGHFINVGNTIDGSGQIGVNSLQITNQVGGTIDANVSGRTLTIDPNASGMANLGMMRASGGGIMVLTAGSFDNTGGTIEAADGSKVTLTGFASVSGGTLSSSGSGFFEVPGFQTASLADLTIAGTVNQGNSSDLFIAGNIDNQGSVNVINGSSNTDLVVDGMTSLGGGGTITLGGSSTTSRILDQSGDDGVLTNVDNTIQGKGQIGVASLRIVNQSGGLIVANDVTGALTVNPSSLDLVNEGTMRATGGAELVLSGAGGGQFLNAGGLIEAENDSTVRLTSIGAIVGGNLQTTGTGQFVVGPTDNAELHDVTIDGQVNVLNNSDLELFGIITNNSNTISVTNAASNTDLQIESNVTLTGGGTITLGGTALTSRILDEIGTADGILSNQDNTIQGNGKIGVNRMAMVNQGLVDANSLGATLTLDPRATDDEFTNTGTLRASGGGELVLSGNGGGRFLNSGGVIEALDGSSVRLTAVGAIVGGNLQTTGTGQFVVGPTDNAELHDVTIDGQFNVGNNSDLELFGVITNNSNTINVTNASSFSDLQIESNVTLTGGGAITLGGTALTSRILDEIGSADGVLTNENNTIQGKGQIGSNRMQLINQSAGLVDANDSTGTLTLDPSSVALVNQGTMRASGGGNLVLTSGSFDNNGGLIEAADGSMVSLGGSAIVTGGTVLSSGSGVFEVTASNIATLEDLTIDGTVNQRNNTDLFLNGVINNLGTVNVLNGASFTDVVIENATSLTGGGNISLGGSSSTTSRILDQSGADGVLTNVDNTILGYGQVGTGNLQVINQALGVIGADVDSQTLTYNSRVSNTNQGTFRASNGGTLAVIGGDMANDGVIQADVNSFVNFAGMLTSSTTGSLIGDGQIQATSIDTSGLIGPGSSVGTLTLVGDTMLASTSLMDIELDSSGADLLNMLGNLNLDGSLQLSLLGGFLPLNTEMFTIINVDAGSALTGTFANAGDGDMLAATGGRGGTFTVNYFSDSVVLSNFVANVIPEPGSATLLVVLSAGWLARRRRR